MLLCLYNKLALPILHCQYDYELFDIAWLNDHYNFCLDIRSEFFLNIVGYVHDITYQKICVYFSPNLGFFCNIQENLRSNRFTQTVTNLE